MAVKGREPKDDKGKFHVEDYCYKELSVQAELPDLTQDM